MNETLDLSLYAKPTGNGTLGMELAIDGIACGACIARVESAVKHVPGVTEARLNFTDRRLHVAWADGAFKPAEILRALEASGYHGHPFVPLRAEQEEAAKALRLTRCMAVAGFATMNVMLLSVSVWSGNVTDITTETRDFFHWASALIALPAAAYAGRPFFASAWRALRSRALNMDVPISLGVILALAMSLVETANHAEHAYFDSALMLLFFLLVGRTLDHAMRRKTRAVAGNLAALKADTAHRFTGDELVSVPVATLKAGDRLLVKPGERVPADGTVLRGNSEIDESIVTGETAATPDRSGKHSLCRLHKLLRRAHASGDGGGRIVADRRDREAARQSVKREIAHHATCRSRLADLCAGRPSDRGIDVHRLAGRWRVDP